MIQLTFHTNTTEEEELKSILSGMIQGTDLKSGLSTWVQHLVKRTRLTDIQITTVSQVTDLETLDGQQVRSKELTKGRILTPVKGGNGW